MASQHLASPATPRTRLHLGGFVDIRKAQRDQNNKMQAQYYLEEVTKRDKWEQGFFMEVVKENVQVIRENSDLRKQIEINSIVPLTARVEEGSSDRVEQLNQSILLLKKQIKDS